MPFSTWICGLVNLGGIRVELYLVRFHFDERKSKRLRRNPKRGIGFEEAQEIFSRPYYLDQRIDVPEQFRAIGRVGERLYSSPPRQGRRHQRRHPHHQLPLNPLEATGNAILPIGVVSNPNAILEESQVRAAKELVTCHSAFLPPKLTTNH